ncbi:MAG: hypothetical protein LBV16_06330 [Elusimicrobiota bacterium]|jgi:hypothetical protein|nr:hypothetical protein [Elusimicrobiota bacterium]
MSVTIKFPPNFKTLPGALEKIAKRFKGMEAEIGVWDNGGANVYARKKGKGIVYKVSTATNAQKAFWNCKGVPEKNIPPRDYQTQTITNNKRKWSDKAEKLLKNKKLSEFDILEKIAIMAKDDTKRTIEAGNFPKNKTDTIIAKRGKDTPLIDSGDLIRSIAFQILDKNGRILTQG